MIGMGLIILVSLAVFYLLMRPPAFDLWLMTLLLTATAVLSAIAGYAAYRLGLLERSPALLWTLLGNCILSSLLTFINIYLIAKLMFANAHDLLLATVLLLFATGIAVVLGYFFSSAVTDRINQLRLAAGAISQGDLSARAVLRGRDELALLAQTFNTMASQLQVTQRKQQELDSLRRDLIAWASHDLQTPLASMRAIVEALADGMVEDPKTIQRYLRTAQREINSLSTLIDDLFQIAQLDAGGMILDVRENSVTDLISDTLENFSELAKLRGITLQGSVRPGLDSVKMDAARIDRVLNNLVSNALRHTPDGGSLRVSAYRKTGVVRVEVRDSGEGISPEDLPYVFERFYRGEKSRSRQTGGAGLGLAIAKGIVEAHGGEIGVESNPKEGTLFYFTLPV
jgi:signal transduction histidine kinase